MKQVSGKTSVTVRSAPGEVYAYLLDFRRHPEWVLNLSRVTLLGEGSIGVGTRFRANEGPPPAGKLAQLKSMVFFVAGLLSGSRPYSESVITVAEPARRIAWSANLPRKAGDFNRADWEVLLEPAPEGTRITQSFCFMPQNRTAEGMVDALGGPEGLAKACTVSLSKLKQVLEAGSDIAA